MRKSLYNNKVWMLVPACAFMFSFLNADDAQDSMQQQTQAQPMQPVQAPNPQMPTANPQPNGQLADDDEDDQDNNRCSDNRRQVANVDNENPNDPTKAPDIADASSDSQKQSNADSSKPASIETTITAITGSGEMITCKNGMQFEVPSFLRKKTMNWEAGNSLTLMKGKRDNWYKIVNVTRKEKVRARLAQTQQK